jgi:hypothetical protein
VEGCRGLWVVAELECVEAVRDAWA